LQIFDIFSLPQNKAKLKKFLLIILTHASNTVSNLEAASV